MATSDVHIGSSVRALMKDPNGPLGRTRGGVPPDGAQTPRPLMPKDGTGPGAPYEDSPPVVDNEDPFDTSSFSAPPGT